MKDLQELFVHFLRDIYYAEKKIAKTLPKMARKAESADLKEAFESHLEETEGHIAKLETVFELLGLKARGVTCAAINGILEEGDEIISEAENGDTRDAGMIAAAQAVEHYEITRYGTLVAWAKTLGHKGAIAPLEEILDQEYAADKKLSSFAEKRLNEEAA
ncbi:ferritin-like domain-containing protein [Pseudoroseicyclus sp. CXY001]|uniref:YciE/YciF ferroxidase family protein n=1 Tax=Pseudoroseicyclus sp. CXY001 TaxID=3242492 RepID=UPI00358DD1D9